MVDSYIENLGQQARAAARKLIQVNIATRNTALKLMAETLREEEAGILAANEKDIATAQADGLPEALIDRLLLSPERLEAIASDVEHVIQLPDPVGECFDQRTLPNGLKIHRRRVSLGVVGVIYEARPNVTVDVASLCLKSGNAVILRGGKETFHSNCALNNALRKALQKSELPVNAIQLIENTDRQLVPLFLKLDRYIDVIIPRGGARLHQLCKEEGTIPVITGGIGVCHMYVAPDADLERALPVIYNAKVQRPSVCNALDTLLVHRDIAPQLLPKLSEALSPAGVELRADQHCISYLRQGSCQTIQATENDWGQEFLALILSIKMVNGLDEALDHIATYSSGHSDAVLTTDSETASRFLNEVDSAVVYVNASTRFTDGAQFGLGAEVAVSTQKMHARGPMALEGLTTYKWIVNGDWHIRE